MTTSDVNAIREQIIALWNEGKSAGEIAPLFKTTRAAVIGVVHRYKGPKRAGGRKSPRAGTSIGRPRASKPVKPSQPAQALPSLPKIGPQAKAPPKASALVFIAEDPRDIVHVTGCRWPVQHDANAVGGMLFCNAEPDGAKSYCAHHAAQSVAPYSAKLVASTIAGARHAYKGQR